MCMPVKNSSIGSASSVVPMKEWNGFLEDFSRAHKGWMTTLETADWVTNETVESHEMPLQSIELDLEDEKNPRINVSVQIDNKTFKHILFLPSHMVMHTSEGGWRESIEIETLNTTTKVHLRRSPCLEKYAAGLILESNVQGMQHTDVPIRAGWPKI